MIHIKQQKYVDFRRFLGTKYPKNAFAAGASVRARTPLGELTAPQTSDGLGKIGEAEKGKAGQRERERVCVCGREDEIKRKEREGLIGAKILYCSAAYELQ